MTKKANLFLLGAQKCGSTSIAKVLSHHPGICVGQLKEPEFFTSNRTRSVDWYCKQFEDSKAEYWLDASVTYSQTGLRTEDPERIAREICEFNPDAKFIYVLREPVSRTYSAYIHAVKHGREKRSFKEVLQSENNYEDTSNYFAQIKLFLKFFDKSKILVLMFDDLQSEPAKFYQSILDFLKLDHAGLPPHTLDTHVNKAYELTSFGEFIRKLMPSNKAFKKLILFCRAITPAALENRLSEWIKRDAQPIADEDARELQNRFTGMVVLLEREFDLKLDHWKTEA